MVNLTAKELKIITLLAAGKTNKEIARELGKAYETTKTQVYTIYAKVGCRNRVECAVWWVGRSEQRDRIAYKLRHNLAEADRLLSELRRLLD